MPETMTTSIDYAKEFGSVLGFKGRIVLFCLGLLGLVFPGWVAYVALSGIAKCFKDEKLLAFMSDLSN